MEKILLFGTGEAETKIIKKLADNMRIQIREVLPSEYEFTIKQIMSAKCAVSGVQNKSDNDNNISSLILFCELSDKHLDKFLFELRRQKVQVDYKAVLTPSNVNWTVKHLFAHMVMEKQKILNAD